MPKLRRDRTASLRHEKEYYALGCENIVGIDEVGRGPWAGPVAAGAVCLPIKHPELSAALKGVKDSKQMTARQRESLVDRIKEMAVVWGLGSASAAEIDDLGIGPATKLAMQRALKSALNQDADFKPECLFLDAVLWPEMRHIPQVSLIGGDQRSLSIASASVIAKVWRDAVMVELHEQYPQYGFAEHKGYGTAAHQAALKQYGPSPIHRMYYKPLQKLPGDTGS